MFRSLLSILWAALRHRPFSFIATTCICWITAALTGVQAPVALLAWVFVGALVLWLWLMLEPFALQSFGCRDPYPAEDQRLAPTLRGSPVRVLIAQDALPWVGGGLRTVIISRAVLDVIDDHGLIGLVGHLVAQHRAACLAREVLVWLGNAPLISGWLLGRSLAQLGRPLALAIGWSLVVPLVVWPNGFVTWGGRLLGWTLVGLLGSMFLSGGLAALGLGLLLGWALVAGLRALLAWEARRAEVEADRATIAAGFGPHLLAALETFAWMEAPPPSGWLRVFVRAGVPLPKRIKRLAAELEDGASVGA